MHARPQLIILGDSRLERVATLTLGVATTIVGASIVADDQLARVLNGVAGLTWFASSAMFIIEGRRRGATGRQWLAVTALAATVAFVIRPSDIMLATLGFVPAGFLAGVIARRDPLLWAKMIPALYLPLHIGTAIGKAVGRNVLGIEASLRTEPPPTAVIVPAVMLLAAIAGGMLARPAISRMANRPIKGDGSARLP